MSEFNWAYQICPWCGCLHDDGQLIQTEDPAQTVYVCFDCAEKYLEEPE